MSITIGIAFNLKDYSKKTPRIVEDEDAEFDTEDTIDALENVFLKRRLKVVRLGFGEELIKKLRTNSVDIVFNIAEGIYGRSREAHAPSILEMLNIPYTGSDPLTLAVSLDKSVAKRIVMSESIPTPNFYILNSLNEIENCKIDFPLFVKLCSQGSSKGTRLNSKVNNSEELFSLIEKLLNTYNETLLIEEYLTGREFSVGVMGNEKPYVIGVMEIEIRGIRKEDSIYSYEVKQRWEEMVKYHCPPDIPPRLKIEIEELALKCYKVLNCRDVARIDIRLDKNGIPNFLEVNPLPGLSPIYGDLPIMARKMGIEYDNLINSILNHALKRYGIYIP